MPHRGRDTVALETMIGFCTLAVGMICLTCLVGKGELKGVTVLMNHLGPMELWAAAWITSGASLLYGCKMRDKKIIEYSSLMTSVMWGLLSWYAYPYFSTYTLTCVISPIIAAFSGRIFWYQSVVAKVASNGRSSEAFRG